MVEKIKDCAIIIPSCDKYEDVWDSFFITFFRYWPDCPFPVYLITDTKKYPDERIITFNIGEDKGWANNMKYVLNELKIPYFIYILEDVPLMERVDTERILKLFEIIKKEKAGYLRLFPMPGPDKPFKNYKEVGLIDRDAPYRTSLMAAFWDTEIFKSLLVEGENAWQMELEGTERSRKIEVPFLSVPVSRFFKKNNNPAINHFATAVKKGRWQYGAIKFLKKEGIEVDGSKRAIEPYREYLHRKLLSTPIINIPFRLYRKLFR